MPTGAVVTITRRGSDRLRAGHVWVYRSDVVDAKGAEPGALVTVQEEARSWPRQPAGGGARPTQARVLGSALYSSSSEIALRMISPKSVVDLEALVRRRIRAAI